MHQPHGDHAACCFAIYVYVHTHTHMMIVHQTMRVVVVVLEQKDDRSSVRATVMFMSRKKHQPCIGKLDQTGPKCF